MTSTLSLFMRKFSPLVMGVIFAVGIFALSIFATGDAFAGFGVDENIKLADANDDVSLKTSIVTMLNYFMGFIGILLVAIIVYAGFLIIVSQGEEEELTKGRTMIVYAIIGVVIIFLSYTIVNFIGGITDANSGGGSGVTG